MDRTDVTYALWQQVYNWAIAHGYSFDNVGSGKGTNHPAQAIDWYDCVKWCNARSEMEGRTPAYYTSATLAVVYRGGDLGHQQFLREMECGLSLADRGGVGKGGAGRSRRAAVSVGQHDFMEPGELLPIPSHLIQPLAMPTI